MAGVDEPAQPASSRPTLRLPWSGREIARNDLLLSSVLLVLQLGLSALARGHHGHPSHLDLAEWLLLLVGPLALLAWRRHPVVALWVAFLATVGPTTPRFGYLSLIVAFLLAATCGHRRAAWAVIVVGYVGSLWLAPLVWRQSLASLDAALILGGWLAVLVVAAEVVRMRKERVAEARAARQAEERRRASEELDAREDLEVVGEAASGEEAVSLAKTLRPDVVLMDIRMPGLDGLEATRRITADPHLGSVRILILTTFELDEYLFEALRHGASGFLVKDTEPDDLVTAIRAVARGDALISPSMTRRLVAEFATRAKEPRSDKQLGVLTGREREVMTKVAGGLTNDEIAKELCLSPATVRTHVSRAMAKVGARDRTQLVVLAYETGLVRPGWLP